ncbi:MAG: RpiB/LacA/LacB family sugar-phosphate isomerase [Acidobacteria bacterium]|nr:RpiB/LacA/LacB family sugar-phosphate isomerase [Acidobacteriota bacterium]
MAGNTDKRESVRALVKQVLESLPKDRPLAAAENETPPANAVKNDFERDESAKALLTEDDFRGLESGARIRIAEDARLTPSAADLVKEKGLELIRKIPRKTSLKVKTVGIGCDHGGYELKESIEAYLKGLGLLVRDFGTHSKEAVDYPDYAFFVAEAVSNGKIDIGIVIDGAGIGSAMAAGKVPGVRPAACYNVALAKNSREHNGANVLSLGSGQNTFEEAKQIIYAFLTSELTEDRHKKRVGKIDAIEMQYRK